MRKVAIAATVMVAMILGLYMGVPSTEAEATGTSCGTPIPVSPGSLTLGLYTHVGETGTRDGFGTVWQADHAAGVDSRNEVRWVFDDQTTWPAVVNNLASKGISTNGHVVEVALYTEQATPSTTLSYSDVIGASVFLRAWGNYYHRFFVPNGTGGFVEDTSLQDEVQAGYGYSSLWAIGDLSTDSTKRDLTMYKMESSNLQRWDWVQTTDDLDFDIGRLIVTHGNASSVVEIVTPGTTDGPGGPIVPGGTGTTNQCTSKPACVDLENTAPDCNIVQVECGPTGKTYWEACDWFDLQDNNHINYVAADQQLMYDLRDHLVSDPATVHYVVGYYGLGAFNGGATTAQRVAAYNHAINAARVVMEGNPNDIVITPAGRTAYVAYINTMLGESSAYDVVLNQVKGKIDALEGDTRAVFCTDVFGASDCNL